MKHNRASIIIILLFLGFLFEENAQTYFCSTICNPNDCSGTNYNSCISCPSSWTLNSTTCSVDSTSGYTLIDSTVDLGGGGFVITPSSTTNCGGTYTYYGNLLCTDSATITLSAGITNPFFSIQISVWIILLDSTTWTNSNNIAINFGGTVVSRSMSLPDTQLSVCNGLTQTYYRLTANFVY